MATTIQLTIAGVLLLAWIWVLGRPLLSRRPTAYEEFRARHPERDLPPAAPAPKRGGGRVAEALRVWWRRPPEVWRRQFLLATMLATFVSFLLAIALRATMGYTFVWLFLMMVVGLVAHVGYAAFVGSRMVDAQRQVAAQMARSRINPGSITIRAGQAGGVLEPGPVPGDLAFADPAFDDSGFDSSAFDAAADIAAALEAAGPGRSIDQVAEVNDLIEQAWEPDVEVEVEVDRIEVDRMIDDTPVAEAEGDGPDATGADRSEETGADPVTDGEEADPSGADSLFRRAAVDEPSRSRRRPKPIYIESQLDEDPGDGPRAVNYP